ncbi:Late transcription factor VLTF-4 (1), partial [Monkeypox virus]
KTCKK